MRQCRCILLVPIKASMARKVDLSFYGSASEAYLLSHRTGSRVNRSSLNPGCEKAFLNVAVAWSWFLEIDPHVRF